MINSTFYFVNNNFQYVANLNKNSYDFPKDFQVTKKPINSFLTDYKSINELQNNIIETINFHSIFLSTLSLPEQIDIKFLNSNKLKQIYNGFILNEYAANTKTNLNPQNQLIHPLINISTDLVKYFNKNTPEMIFQYPLGKDDFLNNFRYYFSSTPEPTKIITEISFLHELGHIYLNKNFKYTILIFALLNSPTEPVHALTQISNNIQETFCDFFATYLTELKHQDKIISKYSSVRRNSFKTNETDYINKYDINFSTLDSTQKNIKDILNLSIEHTLNLVKIELNNHKFRINLIQDLKNILNQPNLSNDIEIIPLLRDELLKHNPSSYINSKNNISNNITSIRLGLKPSICNQNLHL